MQALVRGGHRWGEREMWLLSIRASGAETRTAVPWRCEDGGSSGGGGRLRRLFPSVLEDASFGSCGRRHQP